MSTSRKVTIAAVILFLVIILAGGPLKRLFGLI